MAIILPILSTFNAAGVKGAQSALATLGGSLKTIGKQALAATAGFQALQGVVNFAADSITSARDLERNLSALNTVFGDLAPEMEAFTKNAYGMGISQSDAARTATFLGSVLKQAGFSMDEVGSKTKDLTVLAQDLATTYGYDTSEALTAMTALFRGEYDPIEKFGVALKQNEVNALVAAKGLGNLTGQAMLNAQQQVRLEQLFKRSADAQGAFARQSGTLFVEQKKLTAVWDNMQAVVGQQLTPAITDLMQALVPVVNEQAPKMTEAFAQIGKVIEDLLPIVKPLGDILGNLVGAIGSLLSAMEPLIKLLASTLAVALELVADLLTKVGTGIGEVTTYFANLWSEADKEWGDSKIFTWIKDFIDKSVILSTVLSPIIKIIERIGELTTKGINGGATDETAKLIRQRLERLGAVGGPSTASTAASTSKVKNSVADFFKNLEDEIAKQSATFKLKKLGLSEALIDSVVGSGDDWQKVFNKIKGLSKSALATLQVQFNKTASGQKELASLQKKLQDEADARYEAAKKIYDEQLAAYQAQVDAIKAFKTAITDAAGATVPLAVVTRNIGQFESATISAFDNIAETIGSALADGTLLKSAADNLTAYARKEQEVIQKLMAQRDQLVEKRSLAEAMLKDVKAAIVGVGNITGLLQSKTEQITQSVTKMVGNITVITSKTIEQVTGGGASDLVASFTDILSKTKTFAEQLKQLRALGLDKNLYQQIVDAGIDAGGQTAKAILEGGSGTVSELNSVFEQLNMAGEEIAKQSAEVMYGAGVDLTDGLIAGLISQEQKLVDTATTLANSFMSAFNSQINLATPMPSAPVAPVQEIIGPQLQAVSYTLDQLAKIDLKTVTTDALWKDAAALAKKLIATPQYTKGTVVNVTVKADVTTNGKTAGQAILAQLNKYAKANA